MLPCCLWAQVLPDVCGSIIDNKAYENYKQQVQNEQNVNFRSVQNVTIKLQPHIIRRSNGTGGLSLSDLSTSIQQLNSAFAPVGFYFEYCTPNYINNDAYYNEIVRSLNSNSLEYQMGANGVGDAVNVFFVPNGVGATGSTFKQNWSSFPYYEQVYSKTWTVMSNFYATDGETLAHEIGHYFNLLHTHNTLNFNGQTIAAEHVTRNSADPCFNCETAGDLLCDTEADPDLAYGVDTNCQYLNPQMDACGLVYQPDTRNVMSYSFVWFDIPGCRTNFSQGQINRMWSALTQYRSNLANSCSACPTFLNITQAVFNGQVDVQSASSTITASNSIFNGGSATYTAGNELVLRPDFEVRMGASFDGVISNCSSRTARQTMSSTESTISNTELKEKEINLIIFPNPARDQFELKFSNPDDRQFVNIRLVNLQGQLVKQTLRQEDFSKGDYNVSISTKDLPSGVYFIQLLTEKENITKRLVVLKN